MNNGRFALLGTVWIVLSWGVAEFLLVPLLASLFVDLGVPLREWLDQRNLIVALIISFAYAPITFGLIALLFVPYARQSQERLCQLIGLARGIKWQDPAFAVAGYLVYFGTSLLLGIIIQLIVPSYDPSEAQDLGINIPQGAVAYILTFIMLVILPPFIEEILFRGFLFGTLRKGFSPLITTLATSVMFGLAHGQANLFFDTFALSLVLCYLRIRTGALWAGIAVHMLKNLVAFFALYVIFTK